MGEAAGDVMSAVAGEVAGAETWAVGHPSGLVVGPAGADEPVEDLVTRAGHRDPVAWRGLVGRHLPAVQAICRAFGLHSQAAFQVNQVVWLRLAENMRRIRIPEAVGGWIAATARRECLSSERGAERAGWITGDPVRALDAVAGPDPVPGSVLPARSFARLGAGCRRLLRLAAARPAPSAEMIGAALDVAAEEVPEACLRCRRRLAALAWCEGAQWSAEDVDAALERAVVLGDPVPRGWWEAAETAFRWLCIDAEPADVVYDATAPADAGPVPAGGVVRRSLRFASGSRRVDLIIDVSGHRREEAELALSGRIDLDPGTDRAGGEGSTVVARSPRGAARPAEIGSDGAFHLRDLPLEPLCVEVAAGGPSGIGLKTGWIFP